MKPFYETQKHALMISITILLFGLLASCSNASHTIVTPPMTSIRVVMDNNYPPYIFLDEQGNARGILVDQWSLWEKRTGVKVELSAIPWEDALNGMKNGEFDVIDTIFYTKERAKLYDFTASYAQIDVPIFFHNNISGIADTNDLKGFRVAVKSGDSDAEYLTHAGVTGLVYYNSYEDIIRAAERKEETIFVIDQPPGLYFLYKYGLQNQFNYSAPLFSGEFHRAVKKGDSALLDLVVSGFAGISESEYQVIDDRWFGIQQGNRWQEYLPYLQGGAIIAFLVICLLIIFNRTLQKRVGQRTQELKQALSSLQKSERMYREIFNATNEAIFIHAAPGGKLLHVNETMLKMYGFASEEEALSQNAGELSVNEPPYSWVDAQAKMQKALEEGPQVFEWLAKKKTGEDFWTETSLRSSEIGGENQILAVVRDISERKQAEKTLRESESLLKEAQVIADMGSYVLDFTTGMWKSSAMLDKLFGIDDSYIRSVEGWSDLIHPDHRQQMSDYFTYEVMGKHTRFDREYKIVRKNDEAERWVHGLGELEVDTQNNLLKMHGVIQDITERKQAEQALQTMNILLEQTLEQSPIPMVLVSMPDGIIRSANSACRHFLGIDDEPSVIGTSLFELKPSWEDLDMQGNPGIFEELPLPRSLRGLKTEPQERRIVRKDGTSVYELVYGSPIFDVTGKVIAGYLVMIDITERKRTEQDIHQRVMELEMLYESGLAINQLLSPREIGQKVIELLGQKLGWHHTRVRLYHPQDESLELLAVNQPGLKNDEERYALEERYKTLITHSNQGLSGLAVQYKEVIRSSDLRNDPRYVETYPGLQSGLYVPMKLGDRVIGVISIESEQINAFSAADERVTVTLANQAASALENARLFEETERRFKEFAALYETSKALSADNDLNTLLKDIVAHATDLLNAKTGAMYLYNQVKESLEIVVSTTPVITIGTTLRLGEGVAGRVAQTHQPMRVENYSSWEGRSDKYDGIIFHAILEVPILFGGNLIGVLNVAEMDDSKRSFTEAEERLLTLFAAQAAGVLHSAHLREETERRAREFASLYETSKALSADNDLNTLLKNIVEHATSMLNAKTGAMYLYDQAKESLEVAVSTTPYIPIGTTLHLGEGMAGRVAQIRRPMRIEDYSTWEGRLHIYDNVLFRADLEVPMLFGGDLIGVLDVAEMGDSNREFTEADERLLSLFAAQAAGVLHSARLREETARRAMEFASLYETSNALSAENELKSMLQVIVEHAKNLLGASSSGMYLYLPETGELELTVDTTPYILFGTRLKLNEGLAGRVAQTRQSIRVDDYSTWEGRSPLYDGTPIRAVLEVPMLYGGELIGVLTADEVANSERKFTEADEHLLSLFASQAAGAIHSARLREQTAQRLDQLQALHVIDRAISSSFDLRPILNTVISHTISQLNVDAVDVLLFRPHLKTLEYVTGQGFHTSAIEHTSPRLGEGHAGRAALERHTIHIPNLPETGSNFKRAAELEGEGFLEYYGVPLIAKGEVKGVLEVFNRTLLPRSPEWLDFLETLAGQAAITIDQTQLFDNLQRANFELITAYDATIEGWARAMDLRDKETENHTRRVTEVTITLAKALGIKDNEILHIRRGALLHDIGKIGVPDNILLKEGKLTEKERDLMRQHPLFAYEMLHPINYLQQSLDIPYCHHEKWDGTGYPRGLKGEQIPLAARIFAVADVWDAVTSERPYRKGWTKQKAIKYIREQSGKHFEPRIVDAFLKMFGNEKR